MAGTTITTTGVLYINGAQVENTFTNISKVTKKLESELKKLPIGTEEFIKKAEEVRISRARFEEVKAEINGVTSALEKSTGVLGFFKNGILKVGDTFKQVFTANVFERVLDGIISKGEKTVDELLQIADAMTNVQKTSGMTIQEVKKLWDEFDGMDTRTSKLDRLKIAEVGGRLGVPTEEMKAFVQEVDKAYVALGDSFEGGLEGVVEQLGKIKGLFADTKGMTYAEAINRVGSALNTLAAQGTASEGNISQFALRMGALPDALKPAIDKVLGLGAAFEEAGIDYQIASSGFSNFITIAADNIQDFAHSMNMGVEEAKNLINTKPEEFFLRFSEGMKGIPADQTAKIFTSLKLNSLEVQKAIGAAANKTDDFRKSMKTAGVEMDKMSSLQNEFNQKNNNAPAILDKIKNAWSSIFTSTNVINNFEWLIKLIGWLTGVTSDASNGMIVFRERITFLWNILKVVVATFLSYNTVVLIAAISTGSLTKATWLNIVADKAQALFVLAKNVVLLAYNVIMGLVTGNTLRARAAIIAFNTTTKMSPLGLLIALLVAVVVAYKAFSKEVDLAVQKQKILNDITTEANKGIISQKNELANLLKVAKDETASKEARLAAIKKLNEISPEYLGNLTLENINTQKATDAVNAYTDALYRSSRARVLNKKLDEAVEKQEDQKAKSLKEIAGKDLLSKMTGGLMSLTPSEIKDMDTDMFVQMEKWRKKGGDKYANEMMKSFGSYYEKRNQIIQQGNNDISFYQDELTDLMKKDTAIITANNNPNVVAPEKTKKNREGQEEKKKNDDLEKAKAEYAKALEASDKNDKELLDAKNKFIDEQLKIVQEGKQKELDLEILDFERKKQQIAQENQEKITANKTLQTEIDKLSRDASETKNPKAKEFFLKTIQEKKAQQAHNLKMIGENQKIEDQMFQTHGWNILKIEEKWEIIKYQKKAEALQTAADLERKSTEDMINNMSTMEEAKQALSQMQFLKLTDTELAGIKTLEDAKKALRENADRAYLDSQIKSFNQQQVLLDELLKDPSLSPEAVEKHKKDLDDLKLKLTQVTAAKNGKNEEDNAKIVSEGRDEMSKIDILGFSATQWADTFNNLDTTKGKIAAVQMGIQALSNAFSMFGDLQRNLNEREFTSFTKSQDKKRKALLKELNQGFINQEEYHKGLQLLESETDNKKSELAVKQAKMQKIQAIAQIAMNTAMSIMSIWAQVPKFDFGISAGVLTGIVAALGAAQAGIVLSTPLPSLAEGGFFEGFTGGSSLPADETGERPVGLAKLHINEWVAPRWMTEHPRFAKTFDYLESVRAGKSKPMADGGFVDENKPVISQNSDSGNTASDPQLMFVLSQLSDILQYLKDNGVDAWIVEDAENGKRLKRTIKKFETIENRASGK